MKTSAIAVLFASALVGLAGCGRDEPRGERAQPIHVRTAAARLVEDRESIHAIGTLHGAREAVLAGKAMGTVTEIRKRAGDSIRKGEIVLVVDSRDIHGQIEQAVGALAQAKAAAVMAETNLKRFEALFARQAASQVELDQARYQYDASSGAVRQAEGAVASAASYKSYAEIPAPFDGRVVDRMCEPGDLVTPGRPLIRVEDARRLRLDVSVSESHYESIRVGDSLTVRIPSLEGLSLRSVVTEIVPAADPATRSFIVKCDLPERDGLRSGMYAEASFAGAANATISVPRSAVFQRGGLTGVFVAEDGRALFRLVKAGRSDDRAVEILAGLADGDRVIIDPPAGLSVDSPIEVRE